MGPGLHGGQPGKRGPGRPPGSKTQAPAAPVKVEPPPFSWTPKDAQTLGELPFDVAYAALGADHAHWRAAREEMASAHCYEKFAYVANRLGATDPIYLVLAVGLAEYCTVVGKCAATSYRVSTEKKIDKATAKADEKPAA